MQVAISHARRFETDRYPVQLFQIPRTPVDDPTFSLRGPLDPHHRLEVADDAVSDRDHLRAGEPDRDIVDVENEGGFRIGGGLRLVEAFPGEHGYKCQEHCESHSDDREYRGRDVVVSAAELN